MSKVLPFTVVPQEGADDAGRCIDELNRHRDRVIGLAYVVIYTRRRYEVHLCGEASRSPTFARGAIGVLDDAARDRIHKGS